MSVNAFIRLRVRSPIGPSLYNLTHNGRDPYCSEALGPVIGPFECSCSLRDGPIGDLTRKRMKALTDKYSQSPPPLDSDILLPLESAASKAMLTFVPFVTPQMSD